MIPFNSSTASETLTQLLPDNIWEKSLLMRFPSLTRSLARPTAHTSSEATKSLPFFGAGSYTRFLPCGASQQRLPGMLALSVGTITYGSLQGMCRYGHTSSTGIAVNPLRRSRTPTTTCWQSAQQHVSCRPTLSALTRMISLRLNNIAL